MCCYYSTKSSYAASPASLPNIATYLVWRAPRISKSDINEAFGDPPNRYLIRITGLAYYVPQLFRWRSWAIFLTRDTRGPWLLVCERWTADAEHARQCLDRCDGYLFGAPENFRPSDSAQGLSGLGNICRIVSKFSFTSF